MNVNPLEREAVKEANLLHQIPKGKREFLKPKKRTLVVMRAEKKMISLLSQDL